MWMKLSLYPQQPKHFFFFSFFFLFFSSLNNKHQPTPIQILGVAHIMLISIKSCCYLIYKLHL